MSTREPRCELDGFQHPAFLLIRLGVLEVCGGLHCDLEPRGGRFDATTLQENSQDTFGDIFPILRLSLGDLRSGIPLGAGGLTRIASHCCPTSSFHNGEVMTETMHIADPFKNNDLEVPRGQVRRLTPSWASSTRRSRVHNHDACGRCSTTFDALFFFVADKEETSYTSHRGVRSA